MQTARAQKMPQGGAQAMPEPAAAATATAELRVADDRQKRRPTA